MRLDRVIAVRNDKTVYRDGDACIKVFNDDYSKSDVISEALNQARAEESGLNVPHVREITTVDGKWAIVSDYIKGRTLQQMMDEDKENKDIYIGLLIDLQTDIHSRVNPFLNKMKDKLNMEICQSELDATTRFDFHTRLEDMSKHSKMCHGDLEPSNIIIGDDGKGYIIDWANASQGNASADAAVTYLKFRLHSDAEVADKYLELFCRKSGVAPDYVHRWIPIVSASQSANANKKEREYLLSLVNFSDF